MLKMINQGYFNNTSKDLAKAINIVLNKKIIIITREI